jgi:DNA-binding HxlR family transcriptional regulator
MEKVKPEAIESVEEFQQHIRETEFYKEGCPVAAALNLLSGKWELKIIFLLLKYDKRRFVELKKQLPGITNTVLTHCLKKFEMAGILYRQQFNEMPLHVEYSLTDTGKSLIQVFYEFAKWRRCLGVELSS